MRYRATAILAVLLLALFAVVPPAQAISFDLATDWSDVSNPTGPWTYGHGAGAITTHQSNWASGFSTPQPAWAVAATGPGHIPAWLKSVNTVLDFQVGDVVTHTWDSTNGLPGHLPSLLTWTAPVAGTVDLAGDVWLARHIGRDVKFTLFIDGVANFTDASLADTSRTTRDVFSASGLSFSAGDTIQLRFDTLSTFGEFVGVNLAVTLTPATAAVPEPASLFLFGLGAAGLWLASRRARWSRRPPV